MPSVALGKRSRDFDVAMVSPPRMTRSKRVTILNDDPIDDTIVLTKPLELMSTDLDMNPRTPKKSRKSPAPPKSASRVPLSPQKVNAVFKSSKSTAASENGKTLEVPKTPRRRDRVQKPVTTPRHRVQLVGKPMTPRSKLLGTPSAATPKTVITTAKSLFARSMAGGRLIGRDTERTQLTNFFMDKLRNKKGGCMYVSGPPGCGKTAMLTEITDGIGKDGVQKVEKAWVNCMSLHTPGSIYTALLNAFSPTSIHTGESEFFEIEKLFCGGRKNSTLYVLVLDEIDHLLSHDLLPIIFELALRKNSKLILVGIANALDLADRFLPRLKAKNLEPDLLPFFPYKAPQISEVITVRLRSLLSEAEKEEMPPNYTPFVHPMAIRLLSQRVEQASGDLRKAFDILRRSLERVEIEALSKQQLDLKQPSLAAVASPPRAVFSENPNVSSPLQNTAASWTPITAPQVQPSHINKVAAQALGSSVSMRVNTLNAHQKALLCILVAKSGTAPFGFNKLRDCYSKACKEDGVKLMPLVGAEFRNVIEGLEAAGVLDILSAVTATPRKTPKNKGEDRVVSRVGKMDLFTAISASGPGKDNFIKILGGPEE